MSKKIDLKSISIIHGGPTCGKSVLVEKLWQAGVFGYDIDLSWYQMVFGHWDEVKALSRKSRQTYYKGYANFALEQIVNITSVSLGADTPIFTNLTDRRVVERLCDLSGGRLKGGFFRESPELLMEMLQARGGDVPEYAVVKQWYDNYHKWVAPRCDISIALKEGEFISDYVDTSSVSKIDVKHPNIDLIRYMSGYLAWKQQKKDYQYLLSEQSLSSFCRAIHNKYRPK